MSTTIPQFSFIVPWRGGDPQREQHLRNMLNCLDACNRHVDASLRKASFELIIVEHPKAGTDPNVALARTEAVVPDQLTFRYQQLPASEHFNKSWCMNVGAKIANNDDLIFADADSLFGARYIWEIAMQILSIPKPNNKCVLCWDFIIALPGKDNPITRHLQPHMLQTLGGIWYADRNFYFNEFGGMNESFAGYGGEDNDGYYRVQRLLNLSHLAYIAYPIAHQYHDWEKPNPDASKLCDVTSQHPELVTERIKQAGVGRVEAPTFISMEQP